MKSSYLIKISQIIYHYKSYMTHFTVLYCQNEFYNNNKYFLIPIQQDRSIKVPTLIFLFSKKFLKIMDFSYKFEK